jgi:hypothetical protein
MTFIRWSSLAVAAALLLGLTGCSALNFQAADVRQSVSDIKSVPGVLAVTHVSLVNESATVVVPSSYDAAALLAVRARINKRFIRDGVTHGHSDFALQRGSDRISLTATLGEYGLLEKLRHEKPALGIRMDAGPEGAESPEVDIIVRSKADVVLGFALANTAVADPAVDSQNLTIASRTADGRYEISAVPVLRPAGFATVATTLIADPDLIGMTVGEGVLDDDPAVTVRVRTQSEIPTAWKHYDSAAVSHNDYQLSGIEAPSLSVGAQNYVDPTDSGLRVLGVVIAAGAASGQVEFGENLNGSADLEFTTSSQSTADKLNAVALAHPEFKKALGSYLVFWDHGTIQPQEWDFGKPSKD